MGNLADIAKARTPFFTLEGGASVVATYKGFKMIPSTFNPEEEIFRFLLEIDGNVKFWDTGSNKVALALDPVNEGERIKITKVQTGMRAGKPRYSYEIEAVMDEEGAVSKKRAKAIEEEMAG